MNPSVVRQPIYVQKALNSEVNIGPIPGNQIWWWSGALVITVAICQILGRGWPIGVPLFAWLAGTSWILTGSDSWKYLNRFHKPKRYVFAGLPAASFLESINTTHKKHKKQRKLS